MKCPFCAAESAAQANFCSDCGSPLHLKVCPECESVNEKTAQACMKCGEPLAVQDESTALPVRDAAAAPSPELALVADIGAIPPESTSASEVATPVDSENKEWHVLLQEVKEEVDRQWHAEAQLASDTGPEPTVGAISSTLNSVPKAGDTGGSTIASEVKRSSFARSTVILLVVVVVFGGALSAQYFRPLSLGSAKPLNREANHRPPVGSSANPAANSDRLRDEVKNSGAAKAPATDSTPRESTPPVARPPFPPLEKSATHEPAVAGATAPATDSTPRQSTPPVARPPSPPLEKSTTHEPAVAPASGEETTEAHRSIESKSEAAAPSSSPAAPAESRDTRQSEPAATKARPVPRTTQRADDIAER